MVAQVVPAGCVSLGCVYVCVCMCVCVGGVGGWVRACGRACGRACCMDARVCLFVGKSG